MKTKELGLTKFDINEANCMHRCTVTDPAGTTMCKDCGHVFNSDKKSRREIEDAIKTVIDAIETTKLAIGANGLADSMMINHAQRISCAIPMIKELPDIYTVAIETLLDIAEMHSTNN